MSKREWEEIIDANVGDDCRDFEGGRDEKMKSSAEETKKKRGRGWGNPRLSRRTKSKSFGHSSEIHVEIPRFEEFPLSFFSFLISYSPFFG